MILAIDAASTDLSVAVVAVDTTIVADEGWTSDRRQSAELLPRILAILADREIALGDITGIGVGTGPGSFTGLRVAMALSKGLAIALGRPLVGVPSLVAWLDMEGAAVAAIARAGAREAFVLDRGAPDPRIASADDVSSGFASTPVVAPAELVEAWGLGRATQPRGALAIGVAAARRLADDPAGDAVGTLDPTYVRLPRGIAADEHGAAPWR